MNVLAIDPGPTLSAYVIWDGARILHKGQALNDRVLARVYAFGPGRRGAGWAERDWHLAIEQPRFFAARQRKSDGKLIRGSHSPIVETAHWEGRFLQCWAGPSTRVPFVQVRKHLGFHKANESDIWALLRDRLGPEVCRGVTEHIRSALAVAVTWLDLHLKGATL